MSHAHTHAGHSHAHAVTERTDAKRLAIALTLIIAFMAVEVVAGILASLLIAAGMLWAAWGLRRDSGRVLLEIAPERMSVDEIGQALCRHPGVSEIHDLHVGGQLRLSRAVRARSRPPRRRLPRHPPRARVDPRRVL